jgi:predicted GNAT family N-acyltransferase
VQAEGFYLKQGYVPAGEIYLDEACPHIHMEKRI